MSLTLPWASTIGSAEMRFSTNMLIALINGVSGVACKDTGITVLTRLSNGSVLHLHSFIRLNSKYIIDRLDKRSFRGGLKKNFKKYKNAKILGKFLLIIYSLEYWLKSVRRLLTASWFLKWYLTIFIVPSLPYMYIELFESNTYRADVGICADAQFFQRLVHETGQR